MTTDISLLMATCESDDADRTTWLALADALDETGRTEEAALIRDGVALMIVDEVVYDADLRTYEYHEESGHSEMLDASDMDDAIDMAEELARDGDWGDEGASVRVQVTEYNAAGEETDWRSWTVEVAPKHATLIDQACDDSTSDRLCGTDPGDHDWTSEGEGGLDENPGVWSTGGTSMTFAQHCRACGLHRTTYTCGAQRNPGEHDTVSYGMPDSWCAECQSEDCDCEDEE